MDLKNLTKFHIIRGVLSTLMIFSDSKDLIFNSREPNQVPKTP